MRWLIFVLLISCGKHQEPKRLDLRDSDGDQIANAYESETDKYIANIEPIGKISGTLQFQHMGQVEMSFANKLQTVSETMVGPEENKNYFNEGTKIKVSGKTPNLDFKNESYLVQLAFNEVTSAPFEVFLVDAKKRVSLGRWTQTMSPRIMAGDLKSLIEGKAHLSVSKKYERKFYQDADQDQTVKDHTYRVFLDDGKKSEVLYVSKELDIEKIKERLNIKMVRDVREIDFFSYDLASDSEGWHQRSFANGDKALVYSSLEKLSNVFKTRFQVTNSNLLRENGFSKNEISLQNSNTAAFYFILRASKVMREFHNGQISQAYSVGGGGSVEGGGISYDYCTHFIRDFKNKPTEEVAFDEVVREIRVSSGEETYNVTVNDVVEESQDEKGRYWKIRIDWPVKNVKIQLLNSPATSFTTTGQYKVSCSFGKPRSYHKRPPVNTNMEAKFSLEIESYVEKIN